MKRRCATGLIIVAIGVSLVIVGTTRDNAQQAPGAGPSLNAGASGNPYGQWKNGPPSDPGFFPIAVWLQAPSNAAKFKALGINLYIGLWRGPTEEQLADLKAAGMPVICAQNETGLRHIDDKTIVGWMHGDEPDNAQALPDGKGYGPPIPPQKIVEDYQKMRTADPSRPVVLNLGQGVAWDGWVGRGVRTNHPEDYPEYVKGCDITSFDIYPAVSTRPEVVGKLWLVPFGVDRLRTWTEDRKVVWNCIECTHIGNEALRPSTRQVKAEVWMSLIHGSMGLIYFVHQFRPRFIEAALLADPEMSEAVTAINKQIQALAPLLNSPSVPDAVTVTSSEESAPIEIMVKVQPDVWYVFAVCMRDFYTRGTFEIKGMKGKAKAVVLGENRSLEVSDGRFADEFKGYEVHLYQIATG